MVVLRESISAFDVTDFDTFVLFYTPLYLASYGFLFSWYKLILHTPNSFIHSNRNDHVTEMQAHHALHGASTTTTESAVEESTDV